MQNAKTTEEEANNPPEQEAENQEEEKAEPHLHLDTPFPFFLMSWDGEDPILLCSSCSRYFRPEKDTYKIISTACIQLTQDLECPHCGVIGRSGAYIYTPDAKPVLKARIMPIAKACPNCGGKEFQIVKRGFRFGSAAVGTLIAGPVIGMAAGGTGASNNQRICVKCGYIMPGNLRLEI